jgi:hypothetical protein
MTSRLNPFPGYPVVSITGQLDWTLPTEDVRQARRIVADFVSQWQPYFSPNPDAPALRDRAAVILISGDYGSGKTHVLVDIANKLTDGFSGRGDIKAEILKVSAIEADPVAWFRTSIGPALNDIGGKTADGGWFARLALQAYAAAAQSVIANPDFSSGIDPAAAFRLVRDGLLNATAVEKAFHEIIADACQRVPEAVRIRFQALLDPQRRAAAERWLCGDPASDTSQLAGPPDNFSEAEAAGILVAAASLCNRVSRPFALIVDEMEQFLRVDERARTERNTTWLKRLLSELAETGALVGVAGHKAAWEKRADFLDRFSVSKRIDMRSLSGPDVYDIVRMRVDETDLEFGEEQAEAIASAARGNVRRIFALCRVLFDRTNGFHESLSEDGIRRIAGELAQVATRGQILLRIQEIFEARKLAVRNELHQGSAVQFDLVVQLGANDYFVVAVRNTPAEKEAQDFALQFAAQINSAKRSDDHITALFICDTPVDRDFANIQRKRRGIEFWWIDFTEPMAIDQIRSIIERHTAAEPVVSSVAQEAAVDIEKRLTQRLEELDRRRTEELKDLYSRLSASIEKKEGTPASPTPPPSDGQPLPSELAASPFSATELFEKPSLAFFLRVTIMPNLGLSAAYIIAGFLLAIFSTELAYQFFSSQTVAQMMRIVFLTIGLVMMGVPFAVALKRYIAIENYVDHARRLMRELYLTTPHPRLLAGADRVSRELVLLYGPDRAMAMLGDELRNLITGPKSSIAMAPSAPGPAGGAYEAKPSASAPPVPGPAGGAAP